MKHLKNFHFILKTFERNYNRQSHLRNLDKNIIAALLSLNVHSSFVWKGVRTTTDKKDEQDSTFNTNRPPYNETMWGNNLKIDNP